MCRARVDANIARLAKQAGIPKEDFAMRTILALAAIMALLGCAAARAEILLRV